MTQNTETRVHEAVASDLHDAIGAGYLRCETCGIRAPLYPERTGRYLATGWPKCCGYTMRLWTQRQIDAGEAPDFNVDANRDVLDEMEAGS